jgi:hypothetical protein
MNNPIRNNSVYTTVDGGRLHVAHDEKYAGSINSYNNWLTKLFSKILFLSKDIKLNGKIRTVNKKDYANFLANVKDNISKAILMRAHLSNSKGDKLFRKLISAIDKNDSTTAQKLVGKGAFINSKFWILENDPITFRTDHVISFGKITDGLLQNHPTPLQFKATHFTPLIYAVTKEMNDLSNFLLKFRAITLHNGETVNFERIILKSRARKIIGFQDKITFLQDLNLIEGEQLSIQKKDSTKLPQIDKHIISNNTSRRGKNSGRMRKRVLIAVCKFGF